jgi:hypothetical protein
MTMVKPPAGRCARPSGLVAAVLGAVLLLGACAQKGPAPLYLWETFPKQQYEALLAANTGVPSGELLAMQAHAEKARGASVALPPGFRAHLGLLKLSAGDAQGAREAWLAEIAAFPESAPYMQGLLNKLQAPPQQPGAVPSSQENPA